ncbi:hypothetical protein C8R47DRAFT_1248546 [Mycena vitilis]|nr:hypothetical protein C8R47DRAFT_1248546 [Mycena vitilis]
MNLALAIASADHPPPGLAHMSAGLRSSMPKFNADQICKKYARIAYYGPGSSRTSNFAHCNAIKTATEDRTPSDLVNNDLGGTLEDSHRNGFPSLKNSHAMLRTSQPPVGRALLQIFLLEERGIDRKCGSGHRRAVLRKVFMGEQIAGNGKGLTGKGIPGLKKIHRHNSIEPRLE